MRKLLSFPFRVMTFIFGLLFGASLLLLSITRHGTEKGLSRIKYISDAIEKALN